MANFLFNVMAVTSAEVVISTSGVVAAQTREEAQETAVEYTRSTFGPNIALACVTLNELPDRSDEPILVCVGSDTLDRVRSLCRDLIVRPQPDRHGRTRTATMEEVMPSALSSVVMRVPSPQSAENEQIRRYMDIAPEWTTVAPPRPRG